MSRKHFFAMVVVLLAALPASAAARVLDGAPMALDKAKTWCVSQRGTLPNWDTPANPDCKMVWRTLFEKDGRVLYSARYAWPSATRTNEGLRVLTEVLFEGVPGGRLVRRLYAVQDDEAHIKLAPLRVQDVGGMTVIESQVCAPTGECGRELAIWSKGAVAAIADHTVGEIQAKLPKGYELKMNPSIDLGALSGAGNAWAQGDADCCPSGAIEFKLRLDGRELHVEALRFQSQRQGA